MQQGNLIFGLKFGQPVFCHGLANFAEEEEKIRGIRCKNVYHMIGYKTKNRSLTRGCGKMIRGGLVLHHNPEE
jgi:hypothetical protein